MSGDHTSLTDLGDVVRRTLAARTGDRHLIEDLTQETLLRMADRDLSLSEDAQRAYAVVTARNLLASHYRGQSVRGRHLHRLVDDTTADDPAQLTIDREESEAMAAAFAQLEPAERELLMRHEVTGTDLATLAGEASVTTGAIAMRLARARANLRLEFLLAFRHLELPTPRCRPVLLAVAIGDRRRRAQLDADAHVATCPVCSALIEPMRHRDRRIAGWLLIPAAEGLRRAWGTLRRHPATTAALALIVVATTAVAFLVGRPDTNTAAPPPRSAVTGATAPSNVPAATPAGVTAPAAAPAAPSSPPPTPVATAPPTPVATGPPTTGAPLAAPQPPVTAQQAVPATPAPDAPAVTATTAPPCPPPGPLDGLTPTAGCPFTVTVVTVTDATSGSTFLALTAGGQPVRVEVGGGPALPVVLQPGLRVSILGVITSGDRDPIAVEVGGGDIRLVS